MKTTYIVTMENAEPVAELMQHAVAAYFGAHMSSITVTVRPDDDTLNMLHRTDALAREARFGRRSYDSKHGYMGGGEFTEDAK